MVGAFKGVGVRPSERNAVIRNAHVSRKRAPPAAPPRGHKKAWGEATHQYLRADSRLLRGDFQTGPQSHPPEHAIQRPLAAASNLTETVLVPAAVVVSLAARSFVIE